MGKKFEVDTFFIILDKLIYELDRRLDSFNLFLSEFKFLINFKTDSEPDIDLFNYSLKYSDIS